MEAKLTEVAYARPNKCACCGHQEGPFVDTGYSTEWGEFVDAIFICVRCVAGLAACVGYEAPEQVAARDDHLAALEAEIVELKASLERALASHARVVPIEDVVSLIRDGVAEPPPTSANAA